MSNAPAAATPPQKVLDPEEKPIYLISYPKVILLYPTFIAAIIAALVTYFMGEQAQVAESVGWVFLWLFALNIVVLSFDFPRTTSLTLLFLMMAVGLGLILFSTNYPGVLPQVFDVIKQIKPHANPAFYGLFAWILGMIYIFVFTVSVRFDYWEVRPNELMHHHGFLSSLERFPAPNMRITKEIDDVFEYMLLGSGRLVLQPGGEIRAIVLDNVPFITSKEARITKMLGALQVQVRDDRSPT